jgi:polar amino acid transport system substrate-binding protein
MKTETRGSLVRALLGVALVALLALTGCQKKSAAAQNSGAQVTPVYAATGGSPRPFTYVDESGKVVGHNIELVEAIFARLPQYRLEIEVTDFPSIFAGLDADRYQLGVNNFAMNNERKEKYLFSEPMFKNRYIAAVRADDASMGNEIRTIADLAGKSTLNSVGTNMATAIENFNKTNPPVPILQHYGEANILVALQQVESGQWDFNLIDKPMFEFYVRDFDLTLKGIELGDDLSGDLMQTPYSYLLVSKGNEQLAADINKALREVIADGTSRRICEKYFGSDYSPEL